MNRLLATLLLLPLAVAAQPSTPINNPRLQGTGYVTANSTLSAQGNGTITATAMSNSTTMSTALDLLGSTRGSVLYRGASGWTVLAPGTSGQVLNSGGAGADPYWGAGGGGGGGSPGGSNGQIQYNNASAFGGFTMSGDATVNTSTGALTLANSGVSAGTYGSATAAPQIVFDAKGRATSVSNVTVTPALGSITGLGTGVAAALANQTNTTNGVMTGSGVAAAYLPLAGGTMTGNITFNDTGEGVAFHGGGTVTGASGGLSLAASGTNQSVTVTPSGTGSVVVPLNSNGPAPVFQGVQIVGPTGAEFGYLLDAFGDGTTPRFVARRANGTPASPTALLINQTLMSVSARGYDGSAYSGSAAGYTYTTSEDWTSSARGTKISFFTTPRQTTATTIPLLIGEDGNELRFGSPGTTIRTGIAWSTVGVLSSFASTAGGGATYLNTVSSGAVSIGTTNSFEQVFYAADSATTIADAATVYISGVPLAGANVTLTNPWSLWIDSGNARFDGALKITGGTSPTTASAGMLDFDTNAWASGRGAMQVYDGTANTYVLAALASDTPSNGQVATWNTGGTITWETPATGNVTGSSLTANAVIVGGGSNAVAALASLGNSGAPLLSAGAGAPPAFGALNLAGGSNIVTGVLPAANGGAGTVNGILKANGSGTVSAATRADYAAAQVIGTFASPTTTDPYSWSAADAYGTVIYYGATGEIDLPAGATGMNLIIYNTGAFTITVDPNGSEIIVRDGTAQSGGVSMTLSSGAGNYVAMMFDGSRWVTLGYKGTLASGS